MPALIFIGMGFCSRKKFSEREAERWWDENQLLVYQKFEIEEYTSSNQGMMVL